MARVVQVANFVAPTSGGIRTCLDALGRGYVEHGHDRILVIPGPHDEREDDRVHLRAPRLPGGPYRVHVEIGRLKREIETLAPDRLEVSDKLTLRSLGRWARERGIPTVLLSHERIDAILRPRVPPGFPLRRAADAVNRRLGRDFDRIVCASAFAASEFTRVGATNVAVVPLGVDLDVFHPRAVAPAWWTRDHDVELVCVGRLSSEKRPQDALAALEAARVAGLDAGLTFLGDGPARDRLAARARRASLPVRFVGHIADRRELAGVVAAADVAVCPCPYETFGLGALEALASGTPIVVPASGALPELLAGARSGSGAIAIGGDLAGAVRVVLGVDASARAAAARRQAEQRPWSATVARLLAVHRLSLDPAAVAA